MSSIDAVNCLSLVVVMAALLVTSQETLCQDSFAYHGTPARMINYMATRNPQVARNDQTIVNGKDQASALVRSPLYHANYLQYKQQARHVPLNLLANSIAPRHSLSTQRVVHPFRQSYERLSLPFKSSQNIDNNQNDFLYRLTRLNNEFGTNNVNQWIAKTLLDMNKSPVSRSSFSDKLSSSGMRHDIAEKQMGVLGFLLPTPKVKRHLQSDNNNKLRTDNRHGNIVKDGDNVEVGLNIQDDETLADPIGVNEFDSEGLSDADIMQLISSTPAVNLADQARSSAVGWTNDDESYMGSQLGTMSPDRRYRLQQGHVPSFASSMKTPLEFDADYPKRQIKFAKCFFNNVSCW